jgi:environmental stress-induced protein Ves
VGELRADLERADLWLESVRAYNIQRQRENVAAWVAYHQAQAARLERTAASLAAYHRQRAETLLEDDQREEHGRERAKGEGAVADA